MDKETNIPKYLFRAILILLFIPMLQAKFEFFEIKELGGYAVPPTDISVNKKNWLDGSYQNKKENYIKHNFGFKNWLLRAEHQWAFWTYGMSRVGGLILGKENYLYEISYINARNGTEYLGEERLVELAKKAKEVQDTMQAMGKAFFFVIAPSKADYYPEYIPDKYFQKEQRPTNYATFSQEMINNGVNLLDFNAWFLSMKDTTSFPLYAKTGIHYSTYGAALAAKRIIGEVEQQLDKDLPDFSWSNVYWNNKLSGSDDDLEKALNLVFKIPNRDMPYPAIKIEEEGKYKPKAITIGDSFYWQLMGMSINTRVFDNGQFWYYNKEVYDPDQRPFGSINIGEELEETEVVFVIMTPPNMEKYLGSFVEVLHDFYYASEEKGANYEENVQAKMQEARDNKEWFAYIKKKAVEKGESLEAVLRAEAVFEVEKNNK